MRHWSLGSNKLWVLFIVCSWCEKEDIFKIESSNFWWLNSEMFFSRKLLVFSLVDWTQHQHCPLLLWWFMVLTWLSQGPWLLVIWHHLYYTALQVLLATKLYTERQIWAINFRWITFLNIVFFRDICSWFICLSIIGSIHNCNESRRCKQKSFSASWSCFHHV